MIYRKEPGRAVSGEAAPGEQAPTGAARPGFFLSARFDFEMSFCKLGTPRWAPRGNGDNQARRGKGYPQRAPNLPLRQVWIWTVALVATDGFSGERLPGGEWHFSLWLRSGGYGVLCAARRRGRRSAGVVGRRWAKRRNPQCFAV